MEVIAEHGGVNDRQIGLLARDFLDPFNEAAGEVFTACRNSRNDKATCTLVAFDDLVGDSGQGTSDVITSQDFFAPGISLG